MSSEQREALITDDQGVVVDSTREGPTPAQVGAQVKISEKDEGEVDDEIERWVLHQSHYNQGTRYIVIEPGRERGRTGEDAPRPRRADRPEPNPELDDREGDEEFGWLNHSTDWNLRDVGHARPANDELIGEKQTPDFWCSVEHYGATFSGDRNQGVRVTHHDAIPVELGRPRVDVNRTIDSSVYTAGQSVRITLDLTVIGDGAVRVRDRLPDGFEPLAAVDGDDEAVDFETSPNGNGTFVEFDVALGESDTIRYIAEATDEFDSAAVGPVSVREAGADWDDIQRWEAVEDELQRVAVVGIDI